MRYSIYLTFLVFCWLAVLPAQQLTAVLRNQPGTDTGTQEILQLEGPAGSSLNGLFLLEIEGDAVGSGQIGTIDNVLNLGSFSPAVFGSNGMLLIQHANGVLIPPGPSAATNRMTVSFPGGNLENGSNTFLLVRDFTGTLGDDLDTNNDGVLDNTPWTSILNGVAMNEAGTHPGYGGVPIVKFVGCGVSPPPSPMFAFLTPSGVWAAAIIANGPGGTLVYDNTRVRDANCTDLSGTYGGQTILLGGDGFLPVRWSTFTARLNVNQVQLDWMTDQEINNAFFTVERSRDGFTFLPLATERAGLRPQQPQQYRFTDDAPGIDEAFYRIRQTDYDGSFSFSSIQRVTLASDQTGPVTIFPNPTGEELWINAAVSGQWSVYNSSGQLLQSVALATGKQRIAIDRLPSGCYWLRNEGGNVTKFLKL